MYKSGQNIGVLFGNYFNKNGGFTAVNATHPPVMFSSGVRAHMPKFFP